MHRHRSEPWRQYCRLRKIYTTGQGNNDTVTLLGIDSGTGNSTSTLQFTNTNWRQSLISFTWRFTDPTNPASAPGGQYISILVDPGWTHPNNLPSNDYSFTSTPGGDYHSIDNTQSVYLPAGATLSFSIFTDNTASAGAFSMKDFTTAEVPAPLPITGSSAVLLYSRRLRRRTLTASKQPPALHPSTGKVMSRPNNALGTSTSAPSITTAPSWGGRWCPGCPPLRSPKRSPRPSPAATAKHGPAARPGLRAARLCNRTMKFPNNP